MKQRLRSTDWQLALLVAALAFNCLTVIVNRWLVFRGVGLASVVLLTWIITRHVEVHRFKRWVGRLPKEVELTQNDDGEWTALVTRQTGGAPVFLRVPEGVVEEGERAVRDWIIEQTVEAE